MGCKTVELAIAAYEMVGSGLRRSIGVSLLAFWWLFLMVMQSGCSQVQVLRLTSETFPPRAVSDIEILSREPDASFLKIAELSESSSSNVQTLQRHLLKKAGDLGADAVVFSIPVTRTEQRTDYQPLYSPWGYYTPYYYGPGPYGYWGPWGYRYGAWGPAWGYQQYAAVPYSVRVTTLKGVAIKYR
ncbi:MAG TPA: hypothetical protein VF019_05380 [Nitrospira sp.]